MKEKEIFVFKIRKVQGSHMGLNSTPSADRVHIGIFGRRNAGKSSIMNAITGQSMAIVSEIKGTTTDPVSKAMEILPLGPVVLIDTPGLDDTGELGEKRIEKSYQILNKTDIALVVMDGMTCLVESREECRERKEEKLLQIITEKKLPHMIVVNKSETLTELEKNEIKSMFPAEEKVIFVSALEKKNIEELKELIAVQIKDENQDRRIVGDLLQPNDFVVLVIPIDSAAPKGRLILPQQQVIRDILEAGAVPVVTRDTELHDTLMNIGKKPVLVITDSQAFEKVSKETPADIKLTSFSILLARFKGELEQQVEGAKALETLEEGDHILIAEGCTHHRQCDDIGTVKLPGWIRKFSKKEIRFTHTSGIEFPKDLSPYKVVIHCGGCTLNEREMKHRIESAKEQHIPITNYGMAIAYMQGIMERSTEIFKRK